MDIKEPYRTLLVILYFYIGVVSVTVSYDKTGNDQRDEYWSDYRPIIAGILFWPILVVAIIPIIILGPFVRLVQIIKETEIRRAKKLVESG